MLDENQTPAPIGHNRGPAFTPEKVEAHKAKADKFLDAAGAWLDLKELTSEEQAAELNDFIAGLRKRYKETDTDRKADKKPHDDAGKEVQAAYNPILEKLKKAADRVSPMQTAWLQKQEDIRKEEARKQAEEARKKREEAERLAAQSAARKDVSGEVDAEEAMKEAERATKEAERTAKGRAQVKSATGGAKTASLRTYVNAEISNLRVAFMEFQDAPELAECLRTLAERRARSKGFDPEKDTIPGFNLKVTRKAV